MHALAQAEGGDDDLVEFGGQEQPFHDKSSA